MTTERKEPDGDSGGVAEGGAKTQGGDNCPRGARDGAEGALRAGARARETAGPVRTPL